MTRPEPDADGTRRYGKWAGSEKGRDEDQTQCVENVSGHPNWMMKQCSRKRGHGPDGLYCKQHDPVNIAARHAKADKVWDEKWARRRLEIHGPTFYSALRKIAAGHNDPRALAQGIIEEFKKGDRRR